MSARVLISALIIVVLVTAFGGGSTRAEGGSAAVWNLILDAADKYVQTAEPTKQQSETYRGALDMVGDEASAAKKAAQEALAADEKLLEAMGKPPAEGELAEPEEIAKKRRNYVETISGFRARISQADLALARIDALETAISSLARERLMEEIVEHRPLPLSPTVIAKAVPEFFELFETILSSPIDWYKGLPPQKRTGAEFWWVAFLVVLAVVVGWNVRRLLLHWLGRDSAIESPTYVRRAVGALAVGMARGIVPASLFAAFYFWIARPGSMITGLFAGVVSALLVSLLFFFLTTAVMHAILAPERPAWRLTELDTRKARAISRRIVFLAAVSAVDLFLWSPHLDLRISPDLDALSVLVITTLEAIGILSLTPAWLWSTETEAAGDAAEEKSPEAPAKRNHWHLTRRAVAVVSVASILAIIVGYVGVGRFVVQKLLFSGIVIVPIMLLHEMLRELVEGLTKSEIVRQRLKVRQRTLSKVRFWMHTALDPLLLIVALLFLATIWGVPPDNVIRWTLAVIQGFTVGNITISPADIVVAVIVFFVAMAATQLIQRKLAEKVLPETKLDIGIQHSLSAGIGYAGVILAAILSIAIVGIDLTNFALIAGALSVGIGFGLQNVVNNFVSGLILLVERPIKEGDWVIVGDKEGMVNRVSFRSTELQTFQRASVIIPNADILSNAVTNLTHKDRFGRIEIAVGVAYGSDLERVSNVLLECAGAHRQILSYPPPYVLFRNFGASSLDFELRCYIGNVLDIAIISSDLRVATDRRFREEGINIPFPQRVVHIARSPKVPSQPDQA